MPSSRYTYSAIADRTVFSWPDGRRLAVYIGLNLECFPFGEGLGAELAPGGPPPDVLNYAWRDYGNRVGVWRMLELFDELELPTTVLANSKLYEACPGLIETCRNRGDEIAGHGRTNAERQGVLTENEERALIEEATATLTGQEGRAPKGWLGPWISESHITPDLLSEAGYEYVLDWCHDDQPVWMRTRSGRILTVPYPQELNDIPQIIARRQEGATFAAMITDAFEVMLAECTRRPLVMGIALHPYIVGQPHRFRHLASALRTLREGADERVWFTTAGAINDHFRALGL